MSDNLVQLCQQLTHGVYVIAVQDTQREHAFTAAWVMQVSFAPLLVAFSINPKHYSYEILRAGGRCSINVLAKSQLALAAHFGNARIRDKMAGQQWQRSASGMPYLPEALAYFDCRVSHSTSAGDHDIMVCKVIDGGCLNTGSPLLYSDTGSMDASAELYTQPTSP